jgi:hypothetical protein
MLGTKASNSCRIREILAPLLCGPDRSLGVLDKEVVLGRQLFSQSGGQLEQSVELGMSGQWHRLKVIGAHLQSLEIGGRDPVFTPQADDVHEVGSGIRWCSANGGASRPIRSS